VISHLVSIDLHPEGFCHLPLRLGSGSSQVEYATSWSTLLSVYVDSLSDEDLTSFTISVLYCVIKIRWRKKFITYYLLVSLSLMSTHYHQLESFVNSKQEKL
jgi:hypothetical protein